MAVTHEIWGTKWDSRTILLILQHACQVLLSLWGMRHSFSAIVNLSRYEETTKKAAKWSEEVAKQLHKTRTTQSTGTATFLLSLLSSTTLLLGTRYLPSLAIYTISPAMLILVLFARNYIKRFWAPQTDSQGKDKGTKAPPLPNLEEYTVAVGHTEELLRVLQFLEYSWLLTSLTAGLVGYG